MAVFTGIKYVCNRHAIPQEKAALVRQRLTVRRNMSYLWSHWECMWDKMSNIADFWILKISGKTIIKQSWCMHDCAKYCGELWGCTLARSAVVWGVREGSWSQGLQAVLSTMWSTIIWTKNTVYTCLCYNFVHVRQTYNDNLSFCLLLIV